jgi:hypothetical protein
MSLFRNTTPCVGWTNPNNLYYGPKIDSLSGYYSPSASTTLVSILGENFYSYSVVKFGNYYPTVYFINSNVLEFYVPISALPGTYPVQVFNGSIISNTVTYTIDNASGYWILMPDGTVSPTSQNGITINGNIILDGSSGVNYIKFPDETQQITAYVPNNVNTYNFSGITQPQTITQNHTVTNLSSAPLSAGTYLLVSNIGTNISNSCSGFTYYWSTNTPIALTATNGNISNSLIFNPINFSMSQVVTISGIETTLDIIITTGFISSGNFIFSGQVSLIKLL